jgi:hypothetical protein
MRSPWLDIADADYVGHMSSPAVQQRPALSRLMGEVRELVRPRTPQALESLFHFVEPEALIETARGEGLRLSSRRTKPLPAGKAFEVLRFAKSPVAR